MSRRMSFRAIIETEDALVAKEYLEKADQDPRVKAHELRSRVVKEQRR
jgi:hypothetical protein